MERIPNGYKNFNVGKKSIDSQNNYGFLLEFRKRVNR